MKVTKLAVVLISLAALPCFADEARDEAKKHYVNGTKAYNLGNFVKAAEEYKLAYDSLPDGVILYNVAQAYRMAENPKQALFFYRSFLRAVPDAANRAEVEERIRALEEHLRKNATPPNEPKVPAPPIGPPVPAEQKATPAAPATAAATTPATEIQKPAPAARPKSKKWIIVGSVVAVVVVGVALGVGLGVGLSGGTTPSTQLGNLKFYP